MIIRLSPNTINQIRAGEIIERPAQVVKELVENSIDAQATRIDVQVWQGGKSRIVVRDDGVGMSGEDVELSIERHTTSKLDEGDLFRIGTLGFRGEALASMGAVSRLRVSSRQRDSEHGWSIGVENGEKGSLSPCSHGVGTTIEVVDLFVSTPVRHSFLKSNKSEMAAIVDVMEEVAISHPEIDLTLTSDGKPVFHYWKADMGTRLFSIWKDFRQASIAIEEKGVGDNGEMTLSGFIGHPTWNKHHTVGQHFFINGRPVKDKIMLTALRNVMVDVTKETSVAAVLFLTLPYWELNVNIHPKKTEVKFRDEGAVYAFLHGAIKKAIGTNGPTTSWISQQAFSMAQTLRELPAQESSLGTVMGIALKRYAVCQTSSSIFLVDIHAAHERVVYEKLKSSQDGLEPVILSPPITVSLGEKIAETMEEYFPSWEAIGLHLSRMEGGYVKVDAIPHALMGGDIVGLIEDLAKGVGNLSTLEEKVNKMYALYACHAALRKGQDYSLEEVTALLGEMEKTPNIAQCNHGRPVVVQLPQDKIDALFGN